MSNRVRASLPAFFIFALLSAGVNIALQASLSSVGQKSKDKAYSGPRARISVAEIKDQTAQGGVSAHWMERYRITWREIGEGMREMLVTALFQTKHFVLLERDLLVGTSSDPKVVRLLPPLTLEKQHVDKLVNALSDIGQ